MSEKLILLPRLVRFNLGLEWGTNVHVDHPSYASTIVGLYVNYSVCMIIIRLLLIATANPNWPEIKNLLSGWDP